jgi:hypothetical protein
MNKSYELIKKIISEQKYKIVEDDGESFIIRYQMNAIHICPNSEDDTFVSVVLSNFAEVTEENFAEVVMRCHKLNEQMKQVKFYTVKDVIIAASEFYYMEEDDLSFQIKQALNSLIAAKVNYKKLDK